MEAQRYQLGLEEEIIESYDRTCEIFDPVVSSRLDLNTLYPPDIYRIISGSRYDFYKYEFMRKLACAVRYTFVSLRDNLGLADTIAVQKFIRTLSAIGEDSAFGNVWKATTKATSSDLFLLKTSKIGLNNSIIYHEFFVGTIFLNQLRIEIPTFMFVYGLFKCSAPVLPLIRLKNYKDERIDNFCRSAKTIDDVMTNEQRYLADRSERYIDRLRADGDEKGAEELETKLDNLYDKLETRLEEERSNYLVIENIRGSVPIINEVVRSNSVQNVLSYLVQLSSGLELALHRFDFTHYDLHTDNILMRPIGRLDTRTFVRIKFQRNTDQELFVESPYIPTIIDYGKAHVKFVDPNTDEVTSFGFRSGAVTSGSADVSRPAVDLYRLLGFMAYETIINYKGRPSIKTTLTMDESNSEEIAIGPLAQGDIDATVNRVPRDRMSFMVKLLSFFPFFREVYSDYDRLQQSTTSVIKFIATEFHKNRFWIGDKWPRADDDDYKMHLYSTFYDYLILMFPEEMRRIIHSRESLPLNAVIY